MTRREADLAKEEAALATQARALQAETLQVCRSARVHYTLFRHQLVHLAERVSIYCTHNPPLTRPSSLTSTPIDIQRHYLPPSRHSPSRHSYLTQPPQVRRLSQTAVPSVSPLGRSALGSVLASALGATRADRESASADKEGTVDSLTLPKALAPSVFRVGGKDSIKDGGSISILRALRESRDVKDGRDGKDGGSHGKRFGPFAGFGPSTIFGTPAASLSSLREDEAALETQADDAEAMCPICARGCTACTCTCSEDDSDTPEWIKEGAKAVGLVPKSPDGEGGDEGKGEVGGEEPSAECTRPRRRSTSPDVLDNWSGREVATQAMGPTRRKRTVSFDLRTSSVKFNSSGLSRADCRPASSSELSRISKSCLTPPMRHPRYSPAYTSVPGVAATPAESTATVTTATSSSYTVPPPPPPPPEVEGAPVVEKVAGEETALEELEAKKEALPQQEPSPPPLSPPPPLPPLQQQLQQTQKQEPAEVRSWSVGFDFSLRPPPPPPPQLRLHRPPPSQLLPLPLPPPPPPLPPPPPREFDEGHWEAREVDPSPTLARGRARLREIIGTREEVLAVLTLQEHVRKTQARPQPSAEPAEPEPEWLSEPGLSMVLKHQNVSSAYTPTPGLVASASEAPLLSVEEEAAVAEVVAKASETKVEITTTSATGMEAIAEVAAAKAAREAATKTAAPRAPNAAFVEQLNAFRAANAADAAEAANAAGAAPTAAEEAQSKDGATTPAAANKSPAAVDESPAAVEAAPVADEATEAALQSWLWSWAAPSISQSPTTARANSTPSHRSPPAAASAESSQSLQPPPPPTRSPAKPSAAECVEREVVVNAQQYVKSSSFACSGTACHLL